MVSPFRPERVRLARRIAIAADVVQVALVPAMLAPPVGESINIAIDVVVGGTMCLLLRPHWAFAPTFVAEAFPIVNVVPLWWAAVAFVTRDQGSASSPDGTPTAPPATPSSVPPPAPLPAPPTARPSDANDAGGAP
jgi:hypothetical protein